MSSMKSILVGMVEKWKDLTAITSMAQTLNLPDLKTWIDCCVENASKNQNYGFLLQELVNILGFKLGFEVIRGEYRKGPDGIWKLKNQSLIIESKATSFYFDFEKLTNYINSSKANSGIAVSSEFSADKIAAVKGAYNKIRLITTESLLKLVELREREVITTEHVVDILMPQETIKLDGLVGLIYGIVETRIEVGPEEEGAKVDRFDINDVPTEIKDLGEVSKAMYITLKKNPEKNFESWELSEDISKNFSVTFADKNPGLGLVWSGDALQRRRYITIERYKPDPENHPTWFKRRYKLKKGL